MDPKPFPRSTAYTVLYSKLHARTRLKDPPRLIHKGTTQQNASRLVVDGESIKHCLRRLPVDGETMDVDVFDRNGQTETFQLKRNTNGGGCVFTGSLIRSIINNQNEEIELWGYPGKNEGHGVFVLTVGVSR